VNQVIVLLLAATGLPLTAQWLDHRDPRIPRTKDGKPNLTALAPRMNGKPDLSGLWQAERTHQEEYDHVLGSAFTALQIDHNVITKHVINVFWGLKPEEEPLRPEAATILKQRREGPLGAPNSRCLPGSIPHAMFVLTFKMMQTPQEIVMLLEADRPREMHTDGRNLPKDPLPSWMDTRLASGRGIPWWSKRTVSTSRPGSTDPATLAANPCALRSAIDAAISATWIWKSRLMIRNTTLGPLASRRDFYSCPTATFWNTSAERTRRSALT